MQMVPSVMGPIELFERCDIREPCFSFFESSNLNFFYSKKRKKRTNQKEKEDCEFKFMVTVIRM